MNNLDYSKIEIYTPKINAYFLMSIYFCIINMYAVFLEQAGRRDNVPLYIIFFIILTFVLIKYIHNVSKYAGDGLLYPFIILFCILFVLYAVFHEYPLVVSSLSSIISMFYAFKLFKLLMEYKTKEKDFLNKYKDIINFNTYLVFIAGLMFFVFLAYFFIYILNFSIFIYYLKLNGSDGLIYVIYRLGKLSVKSPFMFLGLLFAIIYGLSYIYRFSLQRFQYFFMACYLSDYGEIPLYALKQEFGTLKYGNKQELMQNWFNKNIGSYTKNVKLDKDRALIIFENKINHVLFKDENKVTYTQPDNESSEKQELYSLDNAIKKVEYLMAKVVYRGTNLTKPLYTMKLYLEKINKLHTNKLSYDKYIDRINNKYIPYTEYLVDTYLRNIDLNDKSLDEIQEKIVYTIDKIAYVIQAVYQSKIEFIKFNLDVELDTVDLLIKQKGYYKDTI